MAKTLDSFRAKHDPSYVIQTPKTVLRRYLPPGARRFIITSAQNGTPVHAEFWACLLAAAKHLKAEILVIPLRYKNPTSVFTGSQQNAEWWAPAVTPYLWNQRHALNENLTLLADIKTQPTAIDPLAGMDAISGEFSAIFGHTKLRLRSVATPQNKVAKKLLTTGACTVENYTDTRTGKIGEFHHSLAALLVELDDDGKHFWIRHLQFAKKTRRVIDLDDAYHVGGYQKAPPALAGAGGDTHVDFLDPMVDDCRHRDGGLIDTIRCPDWIEHDLLDAYSCNGHHDKNPMIWLATYLAGRGSIKAEIGRAGDYLRRNLKKRPKLTVHVVASNHDDMATRAALAFMAGGLKAIPHVSVDNLEWLGDTVGDMARGCKMTDTGTSYPDAFALSLRKLNLGKRVHILTGDESLIIGGIEHGMHGDDGPNGARGSVRNIARIGVKSWTGHGHVDEIFEGAWRLGTGTRLTADYTRGPGSWSNTDGLTNADGKRQLIPYFKGKFRL